MFEFNAIIEECGLYVLEFKNPETGEIIEVPMYFNDLAPAKEAIEKELLTETDEVLV